MLERLYVVIEYYMSRQSVAKVKGFYVATGKLGCDMVNQEGKFSIATKCFYVTTECGQMERFCVAIEKFCVAT